MPARCLETRRTPEGFRRRRYEQDGVRFTTIEVPLDGLGVVNEAKGHGMTEWTKPEYRVVRDNYNGYEVQIRRWWHWPFWWQAAGTNTHSSVEAAETFAEGHARGPVKHLGRLGAIQRWKRNLK